MVLLRDETLGKGFLGEPQRRCWCLLRLQQGLVDRVIELVQLAHQRGIDGRCFRNRFSSRFRNRFRGSGFQIRPEGFRVDGAQQLIPVEWHLLRGFVVGRELQPAAIDIALYGNDLHVAAASVAQGFADQRFGAGIQPVFDLLGGDRFGCWSWFRGGRGRWVEGRVGP